MPPHRGSATPPRVPQAVQAPDDSDLYYSDYSGSEHQSPRSEASYSSSNSSSYTANTEQSVIAAEDTQLPQEPREPRIGFLDWCRARASDVSSAVAQLGQIEIGPPVIYTPRDAPQPQVSSLSRGVPSPCTLLPFLSDAI